MHKVRMIVTSVTSSLLVLLIPLVIMAQDLTVDQVIELHKVGIGEAVLITYVKQAGKKFTLSPAEMLKLTQAKIPQSVIQVMIDPTLNVTAMPGAATVVTGQGAVPTPGAGRSSGATTDERTVAGDPNDPMSPHDSGIYLYFINKLKEPEMKLLEPAAYTGEKSGGFLKSAVTYGLAKVNQKAIIQGAKASIRAADHRPVFYFYFEDRSAALGKGGLFGGITSPNQFVALKLDAKKTTRETVVMEIGAFGTSSGTKQDAIVPFKSERLKPGLYKVTFEQDLKPGEYCFLVGTGIGGAAAAGAALPLQIFDFSVPVEY